MFFDGGGECGKGGARLMTTMMKRVMLVLIHRHKTPARQGPGVLDRWTQTTLCKCHDKLPAINATALCHRWPISHTYLQFETFIHPVNLSEAFFHVDN